MPELSIIRYEIRPHQPFGSEEYDPNLDQLIVVHRNPEDPNDPTEFGHHIRIGGLAYRKEMWGLADYASTIDMELKDLQRWYGRSRDEDYGPHPLGEITEHYYTAPPTRMQSFAPDYILDQVVQSARPVSTDGAARAVLDTVFTGIGDVKNCLRATKKKSFPCKGMTGLSQDSAATRSRVMDRMGEQTDRMKLVSSKPLDAVRQMLTDRESHLEQFRENFVDHALVESQVPEIMRQRVVRAAARRGLLPERMLSE